jgi:hypothetical protein
MKSGINILITAPHARCPSNPKGHECDFAALKGAKLIYKENKKNGYDSILEIPKKGAYRRECDLNRIECRNSEYRKRLTRDLKYNISYVIDVHSYPPDYKGFNRNGKNVELSILDQGTVDNGKRIYTDNNRFLYSKLLSHNIKASLIYGSSELTGKHEETNDIIDQFSIENDIPGSLIEFNENLLNDIPRFTYICKVIVKSIAEWLKE